MDSEIRFSDMVLRMQNEAMHSTYILDTPKSEHNTPSWSDFRNVAITDVNQTSRPKTSSVQSPYTPVINGVLRYDRNSRLGNHSFRRI